MSPGKILAGSCFKFSRWIFLTCGIGLFKWCFCARFQGEWVCAHALLRVCSPFPTVLCFSRLNLRWFLKPDTLGLIFPVPDPRSGVPNVGHDSFTLWGRVSYFWIPSGCESSHLGWACVSAFPTYLSASLLFFCCGGTVHLALRSFSEENYSICSFIFVVSVGGGEFRVFLCCHLGLEFWLSVIVDPSNMSPPPSCLFFLWFLVSTLLWNCLYMACFIFMVCEIHWVS